MQKEFPTIARKNSPLLQKAIVCVCQVESIAKGLEKVCTSEHFGMSEFLDEYSKACPDKKVSINNFVSNSKKYSFIITDILLQKAWILSKRLADMYLKTLLISSYAIRKCNNIIFPIVTHPSFLKHNLVKCNWKRGDVPGKNYRNILCVKHNFHIFNIYQNLACKQKAKFCFLTDELSNGGRTKNRDSLVARKKGISFESGFHSRGRNNDPMTQASCRKGTGFDSSSQLAAEGVAARRQEAEYQLLKRKAAWRK